MTLANIAVTAAVAIAVGASGYLFGIAASGDASVAAAETGGESGAAGSVSGPPAATAFSPGERGEIETIVRDYLLSNPEVIRDAINELQRRQEEADIAARSKAIDDHRDAIFDTERQVVLGNADGDVTLVEFFDYNCGYCRRALADMQQLLADDPNLRIILKEFPVLGEGSVEAAQVSIAVTMTAPDKAGAFHQTLLSQTGQVNGEVALAVAEDMGLDRDRLVELMDSDEVRDTITEAYALADTLSLTGTPSYVTADEVVVGAIGYAALKDKIAAARANCDSATC